MRYRWFVIALTMVVSVGLSWAAPIPTVKYEQPTFKGQVSNPGKLLAFVEASLGDNGRRGGGGGGELITPKIKEMFSEKQLAKLAKGKPIGFAVYVREKAEESSLFLAVPFTSEKEGIAFLETIGFKLEADKNNVGLSFLVPIGQEVNEMFRIKFVTDIAFISINAKPELYASKKLLPYTVMVDEKNPAEIYLETNPALVSESQVKWMTTVFGTWKQSMAQLATNAALGNKGQEIVDFANGWLDWAGRNSEAIHTQAEKVSLAISIEDKTFTNTWALTVKPKVKTQLAASIAKHPASEGRFHQLLTDKLVIGKSFSITALGKELAKPTFGMFLMHMEQGLQMIQSPPVRNLCKLACEQLKEQLVQNKGDIAFVVPEANNKGQFSGIVAVSLADPASLEKTWKTSVAEWMKEDKDLLKLDAEKIGEVNVHTITYKDVPKSLADTFGKEVVIRVGFGAKAMFMTVGPDGGKCIETAAALKSKPAPATAFEYHNGRVKAFASKLGMPVSELDNIDSIFGKNDGKLPFYNLNVTAGETLVVTWKQNRLGIMGLFAPMFGIR